MPITKASSKPLSKNLYEKIEINPFDKNGQINPNAFTQIAPPGFLSHTGYMWMSEDFNDPI